MRIVVADTGPLQYLLLIGQIDILPRLFESVTIPAAVQKEMLHPAAPQAVRTWAQTPPSWLAVTPDVPDSDAALQRLGAGERAAIVLALAMRAELVLMDESCRCRRRACQGAEHNRHAGRARPCRAQRPGRLEAAFDQLKATNFRRPPAILEAMLAAWRRDVGP